MGLVTLRVNSKMTTLQNGEEICTLFNDKINKGKVRDGTGLFFRARVGPGFRDSARVFKSMIGPHHGLL